MGQCSKGILRWGLFFEEEDGSMLQRHSQMGIILRGGGWVNAPKAFAISKAILRRQIPSHQLRLFSTLANDPGFIESRDLNIKYSEHDNDFSHPPRVSWGIEGNIHGLNVA